MKIKIAQYEDSDFCLIEDLEIDEKHRLCVHPLYECPEDAIIGRDLVSCSDVVDYMKEAYEAGKRGEDFIVEVVKEDE